MQASDIKKVLIIGSGTMGRHIGLQNALFGCDVVLYDINEEILQKAVTHIGKIAAGLVRGGYITEEMAEAAKARITTTTDMAAAAADADLVNESIPESIELKKRSGASSANTSRRMPSLPPIPRRCYHHCLPKPAEIRHGSLHGISPCRFLY